jgi:hypothetical protein
MTVYVRKPGKTSGAFRFACPFLCFFLLGKQKKEYKPTSLTVIRRKYFTPRGVPYRF